MHHSASKIVLASILLSSPAYALTRTKANNTTSLDQATSWNAAVSKNDIASWGNTVTAPNAIGTLGADVSWLGIQVLAPQGPVSISGAFTITLGGAAVQTRTGDDNYPSGATIDLSTTGGQNLSISSNVALLASSGQTWKIEAARALTLSGGFTRGAGATLNIQGGTPATAAGAVSISGVANNASGIVGSWATYGAGATTQYATKNGGGFIVGLAGTDVATGAGIVDPTGNYNFTATSGSLAGTSSNTLRYTGVGAGALTGDFQTNGILNSGTAALTLSGNVTIGSERELVVTTPDTTRNITLSGVIADNSLGASGFTKGGLGVVTLSGNNTYKGATVVSAGTLSISSNGALGTTDAGTTIYTANGGTLRLSNNITTAEAITFVGGDPHNLYSRVLDNASGTNNLTGLITLADNARFGSTGAAGTSILNIKGGINVNGKSLVLNMNGNTIAFTDVAITGGGGLYSDQAATIIMGVAGNNIGSIVVGGGTTLRATVANALAGNIQLGVNYSNTGTVDTVDLNGFSQTISELKQVNSATAVTSPGPGPIPAPGRGIVTSASAATLTINQSSTTTFDGRLTGALALTKQGSGNLHLNGDNTFTGDTKIEAGTITLNNTVASSQTGTTTNDSATISGLNTTNLAIGQTVTGTGITAGASITAISGNTITINVKSTGVTGSTSLSFGPTTSTLRNSTLDYSSAGTLSFGVSTSAILGGLKGTKNLALTNSATTPAAVALSVGGNDQSNTYTGVLSGGGSIAKTGTGTWSVGGANTYTGGTTISAGTFLATNTAGSATGTGTVNVTNAGSKIGGTGSITGGAAQSITLGTGTFLLVGNTHNAGGVVADLDLGLAATNVAINLAGTLQFDLFANTIGTPASEADLLKLAGLNTVNLTGSSIEVAGTGLGTLAIGDSWKLIDWSGISSGTKTNGLPTLSGTMPTLGAGLMWESYTDTTGFFIRVAAVPEPSRALLIFLAGACCVLRRRRA